MNRNIRSGTWTLAELVGVKKKQKNASDLTFAEYRGLFAQDWERSFFFDDYISTVIPCLTVDALNTITTILEHSYFNMIVSRIFESADGDLQYGEYGMGLLTISTILKRSINIALEKNAYKINTLYNTTQLTYNPISNYDRTETTTVEHNGTETDETIALNVLTKTGSESHTKGGDDTFSYSGETVTTPSGSTTTVHETTAFNEPTTYSGDSKDTTTYSSAKTTESFNNRKDTTTYNTDEQTVYNNVKDANDIDSTTTHSFNGRNEKTTSNIKGNIGVTTSQQMIQSEREVADFLWMDAVAKIITDAICIHTYYDPLEYYISKEEGEIYEY